MTIADNFGTEGDGMFIDDNSFKLIFESLLLDTKFILSTIFVLLVFYFTKNKKIFYYVLFLGISYLLSLIIIFLMTIEQIPT